MRICLSLLIVLYDCQAPCTYKALLSQGTRESIFVSGHLHRKWMLGGREWKVQAANTKGALQFQNPVISSQRLGEDPESCRPTKDNRGKKTLIIPSPLHSVALWHCLEPSLRNWKCRWRIFQGWRQAQGHLSYFLYTFPSGPAPESRILLTSLRMMMGQSQESSTVVRRRAA